MTVTCTTLMVEPPRGSIYFDSSPQEARIFIDGNDTLQYTPATVPDIVVGTHNFTLTKVGYNNFTGTVEVITGQLPTISATLIPTEGCIYLDSYPQGAKIIIDEIDTTKITPDIVCGLSLGAHNYRLVLAGYQDTTGTVSLATGQGTMVTVVLLTPANITSATLTVDTNDCVTPCIVNGTVSWTNTGGSPGTLDPAILVNTVPTSLGTSVTIDPGQTITYQFSLSLPLPPPPIADPYGGTPVGTVVCWNNPSIGANNFEGTIIYGFSQVRHSYGINFYSGYSGGIEVDDFSHLFIGQCSLLPPPPPTPSLPSTYQICASPDSGTTCQTVIVRAPANITSATLTVDTNDCVTPCIVNGTVSWTNTGGSPGTLDPAILVNTVPTSLGTSVTIDPNQTITYQFSLPDLMAGTYQICISPDSGTTCQTVIVRIPANIVATAITPSITTCTEPCDLTVDITWTNTGGVAGTFIPTITVNGTPTTSPEESLGPSSSVTKTFSLTGLMTGTYNICSDPNTFPCTTVTVTSVARAGFGVVGMFMMAGLAIGAIYAITKSQKRRL